MSYELNKKFVNLNRMNRSTVHIKFDLMQMNVPKIILISSKKKSKIAIDTIDFNRYPDPLAEKVVTAFADYYGINPNM